MGRKPWRALWGDKLRSSPKWTKLRTVHRGFWLECFCLAKEDGRLELKPGVPLSSKDLAYELRTRASTIEKWQAKLVEVGLASRDNGYFKLESMQELCSMRVGSPTIARLQQENAQPRASGDNGLGRNKAPYTQDKTGQDKKPPLPPKGFDGFWAAHPERKGKADALLRWTGKKPLCDKKKHNLEPLAETIIAAVKAQVAEREALRVSGEFSSRLKDADSWLYRMRWLDECTSNAARPKCSRCEMALTKPASIAAGQCGTCREAGK